MKCVIYKGSRKPDTYLYVQREGDFSKVPASLMDLMGTLQLAISLDLTADSTLAHARVEDVLQQLGDRGFYLQLPPSDDELSTHHHGH